MKTIVATTDFSAISLNAVDYAADMACMTGAHLTLIHVYALPIKINEVPIPAFSARELEINAKAKISKLKETLLDRTTDRIIIHTEVRPGDVLSELIQYCTKIKPYAIVMGAENASTLERVLFGGKTVVALRKIQWPLIVVPPLVKFKSIRKIALACDFREVVESVRAQEIKDLVKEFDAELHVLYVSEESPNTFSAETVEESGLLQELLGELNPKYHFLIDSEIEKAISDFAEENKLDLLIIIPKKHTLVARIFHGSHSKNLVLHTHVPVMALHE